MLRNVLVNYLESITEREFDLPLLSLLSSMGFYDIHFTHGQSEFGKDFIAKKKEEDGNEIQYVLQSKSGNISQHSWRNEIKGQLEEALLNTLSHPSFNTTIPRQVILVTTGILSGNAKLDFQNYNDEVVVKRFREREIRLWDKEDLIKFFEDNGLSSLHQASAKRFIGYGNFYRIYGKALQNYLSPIEIEEYSQAWLDESLKSNERLLLATVEGEILAAKCIEKGFLYEGLNCYFAIARAIMFEIQNAEPVLSDLKEIYQQAINQIRQICKRYFGDFREIWLASNKNLVGAETQGVSLMMVYLVQCARALEVIGLLFFLAKDNEERDLQIEVKDFLEDFISTEPGCGHPVSDRYAVSFILPVLGLLHSGCLPPAKELIRRGVIWICDRYEQGKGIASVEADEENETLILLGASFPFIEIQVNTGSLTATVLSDLAAYLGEAEFYQDVINDIKATEIFPRYFQPLDTKDLYRIEGEQVPQYSNIEYSDSYSPFNKYQFVDHIKTEPASYKVANAVKPLGFFTLMLLLRDRYFPKLWFSLSS